MSADETTSVSRRGFLRAATGAAAASAAAGTVAGQDGTATNSTSTSSGNESSGNESSGNQTGTSSGNESTSGGGGGGGGTEEVVVGPGGELVFEPSDLEIQPGTTVNFVWESDGHNVFPTSQPDGANWQGSGSESELFDTGHEYEHTFDTTGEYAYECTPHAQAGMTGTINVSEDAGGGGGGQQVPTIPDSAKTLGIASTIGLASTLGLAYFLMKYGGDYEQP